MIFNSIEFAVFFPIVFLIYFAIPYKARWIFLLIASYYFYMSYKPELIVLIIISTLVDYFSSLAMIKYERYKKIFLIISLSMNLGLLFLFKYFNFFNNAIGDFLRSISIPFTPTVLDIILPVGISFYTFQTMSYTIDVYKGNLKPEKHLGIFALYVSFFPQLVAGPIERATSLLPQFREEKKFSYDDAVYGIKLMSWGFFKKLIIADTVSQYVNLIYNDVTGYEGGVFILATALFAFQIYCDFSGYSDIAIGCAKMLGFDLIRNFDSPYLATNIQEFWRRWHISLSNWFRDYVYIPLGGSKKYLLNTIIVFFLSGLWHGANYTFILWGLLNGLFIISYRYLKKIIKLKNKNSIFSYLGIIITFILVNFTWIFFRANSMSDLQYILLNSFNGLDIFNINSVINYMYVAYKTIGFDLYVVLINIALPIALLLIFDYYNYKNNVVNKISKLKPFIRWSIYVCFITYILFMFPKSVPAEFIYFQF